MTLETYLAYLATVFIFFARPPGPSQVLFMSGALRHGLMRAVPIGAGDLTANALQILAAGFGLATLIAASAELFTVIKWLGVAYLIWLGLKILRESGTRRAAEAPSRGQLFRRGFLTSAANPYAVIFFAALFPQFIDTTVPLLPQIAILGVTYLVVDGALLLILGGLAERIARALGSAAERWLGRLSGSAMIATAVVLALRDGPQGGETR